MTLRYNVLILQGADQFPANRKSPRFQNGGDHRETDAFAFASGGTKMPAPVRYAHLPLLIEMYMYVYLTSQLSLIA